MLCYIDPFCRSLKCLNCLCSNKTKTVTDNFKFCYIKSKELDHKTKLYIHCWSNEDFEIINKYTTETTIIPNMCTFEYIVHNTEQNIYYIFITKDRPLFVVKRQFGSDEVLLEKYNPEDHTYVLILMEYFKTL
jgi:hypothetical protein